MLVTTVAAGVVEYADAVRLTVAAANTANTALGCGAAPLELPDPETPAPATLPLHAAAEAGCGDLTAGMFPDGQHWDVRPAIPDGAPASRCTVEGDAHVLTLHAWYGALALPARVTMAQLGHSAELYDEDEGENGAGPPWPPLAEQWQPVFVTHVGHATPECDGDLAVTVDYYDNVAFGAPGAYRALAAWATAQTGAQHCTNLALPQGP
jgi:hypothetical protein